MKIIIFDTETIGIRTQDLFNIGYKIINLNTTNGSFKTLCEKDYLVSDIYSNGKWAINDTFVGIEKYSIYKYLVDHKQIKKHSIQKIFELMSNDIKKYQVELGFAYNCNFDIDKFNKTSDKLSLENPLSLLNNVYDIWSYARAFIVDTLGYKGWAYENEIFTDSKKYISTSVESVIKYLTNNLNFKEQHTALSDTQWETEILVECFKRGCDITRPLNYQRFFKVETE